MAAAFSFDASEVRWQDGARCAGETGVDFVPYREDQKELEKIRGRFCNICPVRVECLSYALLYRMSGYWGGTDTAERRFLAYARNRVRCPVCTNKALAKTAEGHQVCQGCGSSWRAESRIAPEAEEAPA